MQSTHQPMFLKMHNLQIFAILPWYTSLTPGIIKQSQIVPKPCRKVCCSSCYWYWSISQWSFVIFTRFFMNFFLNFYDRYLEMWVMIAVIYAISQPGMRWSFVDCRCQNKPLYMCEDIYNPGTTFGTTLWVICPHFRAHIYICNRCHLCQRKLSSRGLR